MKALIKLVKSTLFKWSDDKASTLAASLAFYTMLSLGPLLILMIAIAGLVFGQDTVRHELMQQVVGLVGQASSDAIDTMIRQSDQHKSGLVATVLGIVTLIFAASGVFAALQDAMNTIWHVQPRPGTSIGAFLRQRFLSFSMILGMGFLLLVSLGLSSAVAALGHWLADIFPPTAFIGEVLNFSLQLVLATGLFAAIYKVLPDVKLRWRDVALGAFVTAILFTAGKFLIGLYLVNANIGSVYGAAGSLALVLIWVYYSAQILFLGAEFACVYAVGRTHQIEPTNNAVGVTMKMTPHLAEDDLLTVAPAAPTPDAADADKQRQK